MTAPQPRMRSKRLLIRPLIGVILTLIGVFAPLGSPELPGPLDELSNGSHAYAQTPPPDWEPGTAVPCPSAPIMWAAQGANCVLETHACPESPLSGGLMRLSIAPSGLASQLDPSLNIEYAVLAGLARYPEFCEERIPSSDVLHSQCTAIRGYAVLEYDDQDTDGITGCRIVYPVTCDVGMHKVGARTCRAVQRRTWTCRPGYAPRNEFNQCYLNRAVAPSSHPACGTGAPDLLVVDCADYVATDFFGSPGTVVCGRDYDAGTTVQLTPNSRSGTSSDHWCQFVAAFLKVECHRPSPPPGDCTGDTALCLKRVSATGGCSLVADTIRCRKHQWDFSQGTVTQEQVQGQDCEPCMLLPFEPVPAHCPAEVSADAPSGLSTTQWLANYQRRLMESQVDVAIGVSRCRGFLNTGVLDTRCDNVARCADPPRGRLDWRSSHYSQLAVINAPVVVTFEDIETTRRRFYRPEMRSGEVTVSDSFTSYDYYPDDTGFGDRRVRTFSEPRSAARYSSVHEMVNSECLLRYAPYLAVGVEELWPDDPDHFTAILQLFGSTALDWWTSLTADEQQRRTEARGFNYWGNLSTAAEQEQERQDRADRTQQIDCNSTEPRWCRWTPSRSGYFRLRGQGAWISSRTRDRTFGITSDADLHDDIRMSLSSRSKRTEVRRWLNRRRLSAEEIGLLPNLMGPLDLPPISNPADWPFTSPPPGMNPEDWAQTTAGEEALNEWMYTEAAPSTTCVPLDIRISCGGGYNVGNFTETEYIGIQVHEMRVNTLAPAD